MLKVVKGMLFVYSGPVNRKELLPPFQLARQYQ